ncbi:hypothetical protein Agub_g3441, partial [Astrephomene gubernaculifera]
MSQPTQQPQHLIVLVHGLSDTSHAWDNCVAELQKMPNATDYLFHSSAVNARFRTHDGFDKCGLRLADEIRKVVKQHPQLTNISVFGHSMGGMIARFALGILFDPKNASICGLRPCHFLTLATPHLGLSVVDGPAQVPFVAWAGEIPLLGNSLKHALQAVAHGVAATVFRGTGRHFLALDGGRGELPLLIRMTLDEPDRGQYFFSALRAFRSRACYGNVRGDHWVSWENATIRGKADLPYIDLDVVRQGRGVVREDPLDAGFHQDPASVRQLVDPAPPLSPPLRPPPPTAKLQSGERTATVSSSLGKAAEAEEPSWSAQALLAAARHAPPLPCSPTKAAAAADAATAAAAKDAAAGTRGAAASTGSNSASGAACTSNRAGHDTGADEVAEEGAPAAAVSAAAAVAAAAAPQ